MRPFHIPAYPNPPHSSEWLTGGGLRLGLISNRQSGRNRRGLTSIQKYLSTQPQVLHRLVHTPGQIGRALEEFADQQVDLVAINGGDGTVAATLTCLFCDEPFDALPPLVLLPGGTTNMNAADCGLRGNLERSIRRLCSWTTTGNPSAALINRHVLRVEPGAGQPPQYGMFFGSGVILQGTEYCHNHLHSRGLRNEIGPGLAMLRTVWGLFRGDSRFATPVSMAVGLDRKPTPDHKQEVMLLLVSTLRRLILGIHPYWGRGNAPLQVSIVNRGAKHLLRALPALLRGRPNRYVTAEAGYTSHNVDRVELLMDGAFVLDGERYPADGELGPVRVSNGGAARFIQF